MFSHRLADAVLHPHVPSTSFMLLFLFLFCFSVCFVCLFVCFWKLNDACCVVRRWRLLLECSSQQNPSQEDNHLFFTWTKTNSFEVEGNIFSSQKPDPEIGFYPPPPPTPSLHMHNIHSPCVSSFCFLSVMYVHITATVSSSWYSGLVWHHPVPVLIMDGSTSWALPVSASRECCVGSGMRKLSEWEHVQQDCQFSAHFPTPLGICVQAEQWSLWTLSCVASVQNAARVRQRCHIRCRYGYTGVPRGPVYFGHRKQANSLSVSSPHTPSLSLLFF